MEKKIKNNNKGINVPLSVYFHRKFPKGRFRFDDDTYELFCLV